MTPAFVARTRIHWMSTSRSSRRGAGLQGRKRQPLRVRFPPAVNLS